MRKPKPPFPPPGSQFIVYQTEDGKLKLDVRFEGETVWLTQQHMADLFQTSKQNVSLHIRNIFAEKELPMNSVVKESLTTAADGKRYATKFYNPYNKYKTLDLAASRPVDADFERAVRQLPNSSKKPRKKKA